MSRIGLGIPGMPWYFQVGFVLAWLLMSPARTEAMGFPAQPAGPILTQTELRVAPNPFSEVATVFFAVPRAEHVSLVVHDANLIPQTTLVEGYLQAGYHTVRLDGRTLPIGIYVLVLGTETQTLTERIVKVSTYGPGRGYTGLLPTVWSTSIGYATTAVIEGPERTSRNPACIAYQSDRFFISLASNAFMDPHPCLLYASINATAKTPLNTVAGFGFEYAKFKPITASDPDAETVGSYSPWSVAFLPHVGGSFFSQKLSWGVTTTWRLDRITPDWVWTEVPVGLSKGGLVSSSVVDVGVLYRPVKSIAVGLTLTNWGAATDDILPNEGWEPFTQLWPRLEFGFSLTQPLSSRLRLRLPVEISALTVGEDLGEGSVIPWWDPSRLRKSLACGLTAFDILSVQCGYLEDGRNNWGGIVVEDSSGHDQQVSLGQWLFGKQLGKVKYVGISFGASLNYKNLVRLDLANDGPLNHLPSGGWRCGLTANAAALFRK
jgi:hypothetical protein